MDNSNVPQPGNLNLPEPVENAHTPVEQTGAIPMPAIAPAPMQPQPARQQHSATQAEDSDEIEEHWVQLVETMVRGGVNDPKSLMQRFSELKAEYIRSRYGVEVKQTSSKEGQHDSAS